MKSLLEVLGWTLIAFLVAGAALVLRPLPLSNDSYQYLSVAENLSQGRGLTTSLVHFDTERQHGLIPAPLTTFPPGYPAVVAVAGAGLGLERAARAVSCVCFAGTAALLVWGLMLAGVGAFVRRLVLLLFLTNVVTLDFATAVMTEPLYLLLSTAAVVGLIWVEKRTAGQRGAIALASGAYLLAGCTYWVRYAGLFLIVAVVGHALLRWATHGERWRGRLLAALPVLLALVLMLRNVALVGTWKGGNTMPVHNPLKPIVVEYVKAHLHLILGQHSVTFGVWEGLLLAGLVTAGLWVGVAWRREASQAWTWDWRQVSAVFSLPGLCVLVYSAGMIYAGLYTVISFGTRMFMPLVPLYLLLLGLGANWLVSCWPRGMGLKVGLLLVTVGYVGVNARDLYEPRAAVPLEVLAAAYDQPDSDKRTLRQWVEANIGPRDAILATEGQAMGYLLHRPTVSMIGPDYSPVRWEIGEIQRQMKRFHAKYVILYRPSSLAELNTLASESRFVAASVLRQPPSGFVVVAGNSRVRILKMDALEGPDAYPNTAIKTIH